MRIYGLDFTSAPSQRKPITCADYTFEENVLTVRGLSGFIDFSGFESFLKRDDTWIAGLDFPFGQPAKLVHNLNWGATWEEYVAVVAKQDMNSFENLLKAYRSPRAKGDKQHLRETDKYADSRSPMMMFGVPVGRMFFQGAPRLLSSDVSILPCRTAPSSRIVVEAYPALVARKWISREGYKSDAKAKQTPVQRVNRQKIVEGIRTDLDKYYGFRLSMPDGFGDLLIADASGDKLDSVLAAVQAAWAYTRREDSYGIPSTADPLEGWIVDATMLHQS